MDRLDPKAAAASADWLAHRYDPVGDMIHFRHVPREAHRRATFLSDEYLEPGAPIVAGRADAVAAAPPPGPIHFILHSAFCGSTLLARAFDVPGRSMGLKEPTILQDLVGWQHRGGEPARIAEVLDGALALLARPFDPGEATIVKPSNVVNNLAPLLLAMRPEARALLLHAPLRTYLGSIARKGMDGRLWVRDLLVKLLKEGAVPFGFSGEEIIALTDLQAAAIGWLAQHAAFDALTARYPGRVRTIDSERLLGDPRASMAAAAELFWVDLAERLEAIVAGPAFTRHSKHGAAFDSASRAAEREQEAAHADEIEKVAVWAEQVAATFGVPLALPAPLLR